MDKPENCYNCWFDYILTLQRGTSKTYCALELSKQMSELIDANKLLEKMSGHCDICQYHSHRKHTSCSECDWHEAMNDVNDMDKVEIEPIQYGHWEFIGGYGYQYRCSRCINCVERKTKYCPNCGATMNEVSK